MTIGPFLSKKPFLKRAASIMSLAIIFSPGASFLATSQDGASQRMADTQIVQDLRSHLDRLAVQDRFSGAVLLAKNSEVLFEQAYGFANHAFGARNNVDTKFNLASDGKMVTAVAIMQLAEQGKLLLDETVLKRLADYPNKEVASKITVRELLTHKSGLGDIFGKEQGVFRRQSSTVLDAGVLSSSACQQASALRTGHQVGLQQCRLCRSGYDYRTRLGRELLQVHSGQHL
jgi:CubicO group peptidase (beta-lactamase class C family)